MGFTLSLFFVFYVYIYKFKVMGLLSWLPIVGNLAGDIFGGVVDSSNTNATNQTNLQIMREQNEFNRAERLATQEYNTPVKQRERLEQAGINPYLAMSAMNSGNTTAAVASAPAHMEKPNTGAYISALGDDIGNSVARYQDNQMRQLGVEQARIDTRFKLTEKVLGIDEQIARIANSKMDLRHKNELIENMRKEREQMQLDIDYLSQTFDTRKRSLALSNRLMNLDIKAKRLQNEYQSWFNDFSRQNGAKQMQLLVASIREAYSRVDVNNKHAASLIADIAIKQAQEKGVRIDNFQKNKINYLIREGVKLDNSMKKWNVEHPSYFDRFLGSFQSFERTMDGNRIVPPATPVK